MSVHIDVIRSDGQIISGDFEEMEQDNSNQSTAYETYLVILPSYFYIILSVLLSSYLGLVKPTLSSFLLEFSVIVIPIILNVSVFSDYVHEIIFYTLLLIISIVLLTCSNELKGKQHVGETARKNYITNNRSTINLISVICILAVDFDSIFPGRFTKTGTTGFSLMDVGVGLYVFANGIVAPEVRGKKDPIKSTLKGCAVLIFLGLMRLFFVRATDYHVSELEYGVHWNFYITLAVTRLLTSFILNVISIKYMYLNAILLTIAHEVLLELHLKSWVFSDAPRDNFLSANREGIVSSIGFICLYLFSVYFGHCLSTTDRSTHKTNLKFFFGTSSTLALALILDNFFEISRRLASAGYVFWILFIGISMMWLFYIGENIQKKLSRNRIKHIMYCPHIFEAINYNGLLFFLVGNLLTACVNLSIDTSEYSEYSAILIVSVYMFLTCLLILWLYVKQIKLKL